MQRYLYVVAAVVSLVAILILWSMTRRVLAPLADTANAMRRMTTGEIPLAALPVQSMDEVGELVSNFNLLVEERQRYEAELMATNKELQAFTYAASHDMKAPLGRIHNFSGLLERDYRDSLEGNGLFFLDLIRENAKRLMTLVEDLLSHAEIEQKILTLHPVNVRETIEGVVNEYAYEMRQRKAEVRLDLTDITVRADRHGLAQVLRNLLENALTYSAEVASPVIEIGCRRENDRCRLWVKDNGIGFDMAYHDRIFEALRRLHTYEEFPGSGIGLALAKKAIERMEGKIWAESEPGQGAIFWLELKIQEELTESLL